MTVSNTNVVQNDSPSASRSRSRSKSQKKAASKSPNSSLSFFDVKRPSKSTFTYLFLGFQFGIFILLLGAIIAPHYLPKDTEFYSCIYVLEMEDNVCFTARDLSCITLMGYKRNCFHTNYSTTPIGCDERVNMLTAGLAVTICALLLSFFLCVMSFLFAFNIFRSKAVLFVLSGITLFTIVVSTVLVLVIYIAKMCKAHFFVEDPALNLTEWMIGPGVLFLIFALAMQVAVIVFITYI